ncbi:hypothetical protein FB451DRAFT_1402702 [Mycena latifolia]|nr:hypothetical protein FB451DRAFT_1402702 [Mycena latifolia]
MQQLPSWRYEPLSAVAPRLLIILQVPPHYYSTLVARAGLAQLVRPPAHIRRRRLTTVSINNILGSRFPPHTPKSLQTLQVHSTTPRPTGQLRRSAGCTGSRITGASGTAPLRVELEMWHPGAQSGITGEELLDLVFHHHQSQLKEVRCEANSIDIPRTLITVHLPLLSSLQLILHSTTDIIRLLTLFQDAPQLRTVSLQSYNAYDVSLHLLLYPINGRIPATALIPFLRDLLGIRTLDLKCEPEDALFRAFTNGPDVLTLPQLASLTIRTPNDVHLNLHGATVAVGRFYGRTAQ